MILIILILIFPISLYATDYTKIKNLFDPSILESAETTKNINKNQNFDFILYGIINSGKVKKVIIKPKFINPKIKKLLNKRNYIELTINQEIQGIKLINIDNDTAVFKKGNSIVKLKVFEEPKSDRRAISYKSNPSPLIVNTPPKKGSPQKVRNLHKLPHLKSLSKRKNIKQPLINVKNKKNNIKKPVVNPFLELLRKRNKGVHVIKNNPSTPAKNPFLELIKRLQKK